ncbi:PDZ domain-containing protein [Arcanobacterium wilhelmae]|uniref:PDZ domain-containing protein n=1 Tax=Arcanobacterium wilhelmae TaxID=1803177 RepID=A0ABT9N9V2_9ACTO|nr:S16 family serine protease [Arcanobacterium wilhelmae]MDP9800471.1 PDZ domain-containing protein [Arcanobacterium wilhelmae]WFN89890.1 pdz/dhr/glgf protein [Arcanobacterium wilhelmae]
MNSKLLSAVTFGTVLLASLMMPSAYLVQSAGPALDTAGKFDGKQLVAVSGTDTYPSDTHLYMTTVSAVGTPENGAPVGVVLGTIFKGDEQAVPVRALYPEEATDAQVEKVNAQAMTSSQDTAAALAMELAGKKVTMDLQVSAVDPKVPSGAVLKEGDIIKRISAPTTGGKLVDVPTFLSLSKILFATTPGAKITLEVERGGKLEKATFATISAPKDGPYPQGSSLIGVGLSVKNVKYPGKVTYAVEGIGGPSAGNMFALEIYDQLTEGSLGGKRVIAGTGTVNWNGLVGPIGGIEHKLVGAAKQGATDFLAPVENCAETLGYEPEGMNVWAVRSTAEAIEAVKAIGEGKTAQLTSCQAYVHGQTV